MPQFLQLPKRLRFLLLVIVMNVIILAGLRIAFWMSFHTTDCPTSIAILLRSFFIGFKLDLRLVLLLLLPVPFFSWIPGINLVRSSRGRHFWAGHLSILMLLVVLFYLTDFAHFAYLQKRVDASVLRYVQNPLISLQMVWESYPVVWGVLGLILFGALYYLAIKLLISKSMAGEFRPLAKWKRIMIISLSIILYISGIYGKISYYPLRWSDAFFSTHRFSAALALNPVLYFFNTMCTAEQREYDKEAVKKHYEIMAAYCGVTKPDREKLDFSRNINGTCLVWGKPNVVVILMESFAAHRTGIFGNPLQPSPNFDTIAKDSLFFKHFYTPRIGTARAVFTTLTGIPDVITNRTASRNPTIVKQYTIMNAFNDYEKFYFLGGSANWANIRGLFSYNVEDLRIYEEGDYASPRVDVWGISDLHLFEEANRILRNVNGKPFFAFIHTSGDHRPYSIPEDNRNFRMASFDKGEVKKYGFGSLAEFNSFRFLDHSLGFFMHIAKKEKYFKNTLFLIFGDNGAGGRAPNMPKAEEEFQLTQFHVPFVIYGPGLIGKGEVFDTMASQVDVLPTLAGITGRPCLNTTLGRNLLDTRFDSQRYAFIQNNCGAVPEIGLLSNEFYLVMNANGTNTRLYLYYSETPMIDVGERFPDQKREMSRLCQGLYETSRYLLYHNSPSLYSKSKYSR
jgi:phosphoglycerol transferase MdoB-like AlkP superfamily enzyme